MDAPGSLAIRSWSACQATLTLGADNTPGSHATKASVPQNRFAALVKCQVADCRNYPSSDRVELKTEPNSRHALASGAYEEHNYRYARSYHSILL
eukprot:360782-Chlamydomonas_euryale.AAC.2